MHQRTHTHTDMIFTHILHQQTHKYRHHVHTYILHQQTHTHRHIHTYIYITPTKNRHHIHTYITPTNTHTHTVDLTLNLHTYPKKNANRRCKNILS